jgi:hypothetical protein
MYIATTADDVCIDPKSAGDTKYGLPLGLGYPNPLSHELQKVITPHNYSYTYSELRYFRQPYTTYIYI